MVHPSCIHDKYSDELGQQVITQHTDAVRKYNNHDVDAPDATKVKPRGLLVLDECLYDPSWIKSRVIRSIFVNGRHYRMMCIVALQYAQDIPPMLRVNLDYVFILRENIVSNRSYIYDMYARMFPTCDIFCQALDQCTEDYECLVISYTAKSNNIEDIEDTVFRYKTESHPPFCIG
jgi:hypothetical protein